MRNRATAERAGPHVVVVILISIVLHLGLVAAFFVSFSKKLDIPADSVSVVPVDLVTVGEKTNIAPMVKKEDVAPPDVKDIEPTPTPDVAPPKFEVAPDAKPEPKKPEAKFDINDIEKLLAHKKPINARVGPQTFAGVGAGTALTADLASVLFSQIQRCWTPPTGAVNAEKLVVVYEIYLDKTGTVSGDPKLLSEGAPLNTPRDAANQAAFRAIKMCQPYKLPANRYNEWRHFSFRFDPHFIINP